MRGRGVLLCLIIVYYEGFCHGWLSERSPLTRGQIIMAGALGLKGGSFDWAERCVVLVLSVIELVLLF